MRCIMFPFSLQDYPGTNHLEAFLTTIWALVYPYQPVRLKEDSFMTSGFISIWKVILEIVEPYKDESSIQTFDDVVDFAVNHDLVEKPEKVPFINKDISVRYLYLKQAFKIWTTPLSFNIQFSVQIRYSTQIFAQLLELALLKFIKFSERKYQAKFFLQKNRPKFSRFGSLFLKI